MNAADANEEERALLTNSVPLSASTALMGRLNYVWTKLQKLIR